MAMFNFLKKRLKKFEDQLEDELASEFSDKVEQESAEPEEQIKQQPEPEQTPEEEIPPKAPVEPEKKEEKKVPSPHVVQSSRKRARKREMPVSEEKKKREEQRDKQIESSIETELQRIVKTRRSIEETMGSTQASGGRVASIDQEKLNEMLWELEMGLLESDVAYSVIDSIKKDIGEQLQNVSLSKIRSSDFVKDVLKKAILHVLDTSRFDFDEFLKTTDRPIVIMFVGVNGTGKTMSIGKMAYYLKQKGMTSVMAAGDTFRAGAIEQLGVHADNLGVKIIKHGPGADPAAVAYDALEHAKARHKDVVLLDTAGRMQTNYNLMDEMAKIKKVAKPDLIIFVGDALSGNDAVEQAKRFNEVVGINGVILTKVDTDAKGGSSLSIAYTIGKPLLFIGMGQEYPDQIPFNPEWMIENLLLDEE